MTEPPTKKRRKVWTLDEQYPFFLKVYPNLLPLEDCRTFWNTQDVYAYEKKLQHVVNGQLKLTGRFADVKNGHTQNYSTLEGIEIRRAASLRVPPDQRQQNRKETRLIQAFITLINVFIRDSGGIRVEWMYQFDNLKSDLLCRFVDDQQGLFRALQFKMSTFKRNMMFHKTNGYANMILVCGGLDEQNVIKELLVFTEPLQRKSISVTSGYDSSDPVVQAARAMTLPKIYEAMRLSVLKSRDEWVYGHEQSMSTSTTVGLMVQQLFERILGVWVTAPVEQNQAVDAYLGGCALSFKTACACGNPKGGGFLTGKAKNSKDVDVIVVGFKTNGLMTSLGVMSQTSVDRSKSAFYWGLTKPFPGTLNLTTRDGLLFALRLYSGKTINI